LTLKKHIFLYKPIVHSWLLLLTLRTHTSARGMK